MHCLSSMAGVRQIKDVQNLQVPSVEISKPWPVQIPADSMPCSGPDLITPRIGVKLISNTLVALARGFRL